MSVTHEASSPPRPLSSPAGKPKERSSYRIFQNNLHPTGMLCPRAVSHLSLAFRAFALCPLRTT